MFTTRKAQYPGNDVLTAEFAAHATPEQLALANAFLGANATWGDIDARWGVWGIFDRVSRTDVITFNRISGAIEVADRPTIAQVVAPLLDQRPSMPSFNDGIIRGNGGGYFSID